MKPLTFLLSLEETNLILDSLGQQPYVKVYELIDKLRAAAQTQLQQEQQERPLRPNDSQEAS